MYLNLSEDYISINMSKKSLIRFSIISVIALAFAFSLFFIPEFTSSEQSWIIDGNRVYVDDSNAFIQAEPRTLSGSGDVYFDVMLKSYTGDIDVVWGFDTDEVKPTDAWLYSPYEVNTTHSYTCSGDYFNYTLNPKHFYCWNLVQDNDTFEWYHELEGEGDFEWGDIPSKTAYWNVSRIVDYKKISGAFQSIDYEYGGMDRWWYKKNVPVVAGNNYQVKIDMNMPFNQESQGKYWFCTKPSSETIQEAISNEHLYCLDPWWNTTTYGYAYEILSTATVAGMPISVNDTHGVGPSKTIFWTNNSSAVETKWLVSTGPGATGTLDVGNEDDRTPWENESSNEGYLSTDVWSNFYHVYHQDNITQLDSTSNNVIATMEGNPQPIAGVFGGAIDYDGTGDTYQVPAYGALVDNDFTAEFWFYPTVSERTMPWNFEGDIKLFFQFDQDPNFDKIEVVYDGVHLVCSEVLALNEWYYVALVYNNSAQDLHLYLNGTYCGSDTGVTWVDKATGNYIGSYASSSLELDGMMDEVRFSSVGRSEAYIDAVWRNGQNILMTLGAEEVPPPVDSITLNYPANSSGNPSSTIDFEYTPIFHNEDIINCSLFTNETAWTLKHSNESDVVNNSINIIQETFGSADYYKWNIQCCDSTTCINASANWTLSTIYGWWDTDYPYGYEILSTAEVAGMPISVNDTSGVGSSNIIMWTNNASTDRRQWLISTGAGVSGDLSVSNSTDHMFWENETNLTGNSPQSVWDTNYEYVFHAHNSSMIDSTSNNLELKVWGQPNTAPSVGVFGNAAYFNGSNGNYYNHSNLGIFDGDFTIEFWVKFDENVSVRTYLFQWDGEKEMGIELSPSEAIDKLSFVWYEDENRQLMIPNDTTELDRWYYYVIVVNNSNSDGYMYINGSLQNSTTTIGTIDDKNKGSSIGSDRDGLRPLNGSMDEIRMSNIGRSEAYIEATWKNGINELMVPTNVAPQFYDNITKLANGTAFNTANTFGWQTNWTDADGNFDNATFQLGRPDGTYTNYTNSTSPISVIIETSDIFYINFTQEQLGPAGTFNVTWYGNDTDGLESNTEAVLYTVVKRSTTSTALLNSSGEDSYREYGEALNLTGNVTDDLTVYLDLNATDFGDEYTSGTGTIMNYTSTKNLGWTVTNNISFNFTVHTAGDENHSTSSDTLHFWVDDSTEPGIRNVGTDDDNDAISEGEEIELTAEGYDLVGLDWAWLATNESGSWKNHTEEGIILFKTLSNVDISYGGTLALNRTDIIPAYYWVTNFSSGGNPNCVRVYDDSENYEEYCDDGVGPPGESPIWNNQGLVTNFSTGTPNDWWTFKRVTFGAGNNEICHVDGIFEEISCCALPQAGLDKSILGGAINETVDQNNFWYLEETEESNNIWDLWHVDSNCVAQNVYNLTTLEIDGPLGVRLYRTSGWDSPVTKLWILNGTGTNTKIILLSIESGSISIENEFDISEDLSPKGFDHADYGGLDYFAISNTTNGKIFVYEVTIAKILDLGDVADTWTWANFSWSNSSVTSGTTVAWKIYFNDTSGNVNVTSEQTFRIINETTTTLPQLISMDDIISRISGVLRTLTQDAIITDVISRISNFIREVTENPILSDLVSRIYAPLRMISQSLNIDDAVSRIYGVVRTMYQSLKISDAVSRLTTLVKTIPQSIKISDVVNRLTGLSKTIPQSIKISDVAFRIGDISKLLQQSINIDDAVSRVYGAVRTISETLKIADAVNILLSSLKILQQSILFGKTDSITLTYTNVLEDTWVNSASSTELYGNASSIQVEYVGAQPWTRRGYIKYDLTSLPDGATVNNAKLFAKAQTYGSGMNVTIHEVTNQTWEENKTIWDDKPSYNINIEGNVEEDDGDDTWYNWTVTDVIQRASDNNYDNVSFLLKQYPEVGSQQFAVYSKEYVVVASRHNLTIDYTINYITVSRIVGFARTLQENPAISDLVSRLVAFTRTISQIIKITDIVTKLRNVPRIITQALKISDVIDRVANFIRVLAQGINISDILIRVANFIRVISQNIKITDAVSRASRFFVILSENPVISDTVSRVYGAIRTIAQSLSIDDAVSRLTALTRIILQTIKILDVIKRAQAFSRVISEAIKTSDIVSKVVGFIRILQQNVIITDAIITLQATIKNIQQNIVISDAVSKLGALQRTISQTLNIDDVVSIIFGVTRKIAQSLSIDDAVSRLNAFVGTISQSLKISDVVSRLTSLSRTISQSLSIDDAVSRLNALARTISQTLRITDIISRLYGAIRTIPQTLKISDAVSRLTTLVKTIPQALHITDVVSRVSSFLRTISQTLRISDLVSRIVAFLRSLLQRLRISEGIGHTTITFHDSIQYSVPNFTVAGSMNVYMNITAEIDNTNGVEYSDSISYTLPVGTDSWAVYEGRYCEGVAQASGVGVAVSWTADQAAGIVGYESICYTYTNGATLGAISWVQDTDVISNLTNQFIRTDFIVTENVGENFNISWVINDTMPSSSTPLENVTNASYSANGGVSFNATAWFDKIADSPGSSVQNSAEISKKTPWTKSVYLVNNWDSSLTINASITLVNCYTNITEDNYVTDPLGNNETIANLTGIVVWNETLAASETGTWNAHYKTPEIEVSRNETAILAGVWYRYFELDGQCVEIEDVFSYAPYDSDYPSLRLYDDSLGAMTDVTVDADYAFGYDNLQANWTIPNLYTTGNSFVIKGMAVSCTQYSKEIQNPPIKTNQNVEWEQLVQCTNLKPAFTEYTIKWRMPFDARLIKLNDTEKERSFDAYGAYIVLEGSVDVNESQIHSIDYVTDAVTADLTYSYPEDRREKWVVDEEAEIIVDISIKSWSEEAIDEKIQKEIPLYTGYGESLELFYLSELNDTQDEAVGKYDFEIDGIGGSESRTYQLNYTVVPAISEKILERPEPQTGLIASIYKIIGTLSMTVTELWFEPNIDYNITDRTENYDTTEALEFEESDVEENVVSINLGTFSPAEEMRVSVFHGAKGIEPESPFQPLIEWMNEEVEFPFISDLTGLRYKRWEIGVVVFVGGFLIIAISYYALRKKGLIPEIKLPKLPQRKKEEKEKIEVYEQEE